MGSDDRCGARRKRMLGRSFGVKTQRVERRTSVITAVEQDGQFSAAEDYCFRALPVLQALHDLQCERPRLVRKDAARHLLHDETVQCAPDILVRDHNVEMPSALEPPLDERSFHGGRRSQQGDPCAVTSAMCSTCKPVARSISSARRWPVLEQITMKSAPARCSARAALM